MVIVGTAGLSVLALPTAFTMDWRGVGPTEWLAVVGSGAISISVGSVLWAVGVKHLGPGKTANFANLTPVFTLLIAVAALGEQLSPLRWAGLH